ncbi:MAG: glycosyltransferase [Deltaproteobacteria bacterium]|nr:glycosyltransferase [Candidatus Tharpella aukensis]
MNDNISSRNKYLAKRIRHWNTIASKSFSDYNSYYHRYLECMYQYMIPPGLRVLEIGCGKGDLLASIAPRVGVGVDFSKEMILQARRKHPQLHFYHSSGEDAQLEGTFDVVILSDLLNNVWDVQELLASVRSYCNDSTRIIMNVYSRLWQPFLTLIRKIGLAAPMLPQNWLTVDDLKNLLYLEDFDCIQTSSEIIIPVNIPLLSNMANRYFAKIFPLRFFCLTNVLIARKKPVLDTLPEKPLVSIIVAARNEEGNIVNIFKRTPEMGRGTELIFVEGGSSDNTFATIEKEIKKNPQKRVFAYRQSGKGKGDAVRLGFSKATGDILMILDADMTVAPEDLPLFYNALVSGKGEFINGVRLVYPMEREAMRFCNLVGNKFFSMAFSWLLGQSIKDTLCGTKVLTRKNYEKIAANRAYFGDFDPFGDFDLIFGAAKQNLKIVDLPIRYRDRHYGETNISRWRHGVILLKMVIFAASKIKFH